MRIIATLLAALLLFSACTEDPEPKEPKKSSTPKPTATAPTLPPEAKAKPPEGAAAFVSHYIDTFNYAAKTGDTTQLLRLSSECDVCSNYAQEFERIYKRGDQIDEVLWRSTSSNVLVNKQSVEVIAVVETKEEKQSGSKNLGFTLTTKPPYRVTEIFEAVDK